MDWSNKLKHASSSIVAHDPESVSAEYGQHFPAEKSSHRAARGPFLAQANILQSWPRRGGTSNIANDHPDPPMKRWKLKVVQ